MTCVLNIVEAYFYLFDRYCFSTINLQFHEIALDAMTE